MKTEKDNTYGLLHFQAVNWRNMRIRKAWYQCLERIPEPRYSVESLNKVYDNSIDEKNLRLFKCPSNWYKGYDFFDKTIPMKDETWKEQYILQWFEQYGHDYFKGLHIWDIDWQEH